MKNESFAEIALNAGFKSFPENYNHKNGWYGVSGAGKYPDAVLYKGRCHIHISIQGFLMPTPEIRTQKFFELSDCNALKFIGFFYNNQPLYLSWFGELPDENFINSFINKASDIAPILYTMAGKTILNTKA